MEILLSNDYPDFNTILENAYPRFFLFRKERFVKKEPVYPALRKM
jgi:hypothetical protein